MGRHFDKWGVGGTPYTPQWLQFLVDSVDWTLNVVDMASILFARPAVVRTQSQNQFNLPQQIVTTFDVYPATAANVQLNTITLDSVPWLGIYFSGNPIKMSAVPNSGYEFLYWEYASPRDTTRYYNSVLRIDVDSADYFRAVFKTIPPPENGFSVFPNPFADQVTINYSISERGPVEIRILDITGQVVAIPVPSSSYVNPGNYSVTIDATVLGLAGGMYFFELKSRDHRSVQKVVCGRPKQ